MSTQIDDLEAEAQYIRQRFIELNQLRKQHRERVIALLSTPNCEAQRLIDVLEMTDTREETSNAK